MRTKGEIDGVQFICIKWSIKALSYEYKLWDSQSSKIIFVDTMKELRSQIANFKGFEQYEQGEIQVRSMQNQRQA